MVSLSAKLASLRLGSGRIERKISSISRPKWFILYIVIGSVLWEWLRCFQSCYQCELYRFMPMMLSTYKFILWGSVLVSLFASLLHCPLWRSVPASFFLLVHACSWRPVSVLLVKHCIHQCLLACERSPSCQLLIAVALNIRLIVWWAEMWQDAMMHDVDVDKFLTLSEHK